MNKVINQLHREIAEQLLWYIVEQNENAVMTYKELCKRIKNQLTPINCGGYLGTLSEYCVDHDMPLISAMVVSGDSGMPGGGFYDFYNLLKGTKIKDRQDLFIQALKEIADFNEWYRLAELLELDKELIGKLKEKSGVTMTVSTLSVEEGRMILRTHLERERKPGIAKAAKEKFIADHGSLYCELCGLNPSDLYRDLKCNIINAHHRYPLGERDGSMVTRLEDFMMLCPNCHSVVHQNVGVELERI